MADYKRYNQATFKTKASVSFYFDGNWWRVAYLCLGR